MLDLGLVKIEWQPTALLDICKIHCAHILYVRPQFGYILDGITLSW